MAGQFQHGLTDAAAGILAVAYGDAERKLAEAMIEVSHRYIGTWI